MKKVISMTLVIVLLLSLLPMQAFASDSPIPSPMERSQRKLGLADIGSNGYQTLRTSQKMLDILKVMEGYSQKAFWDHQQYSIGYGTKAKYQNEILPDGEAGYEEAEKRLIEDIRSRENYVNNYCQKTLKKQPSQNQFDAMVSLVYNLGTGWFFNSRLASWLSNPTTEIEFVDAYGQWCGASGQILYGLMQRRIREAIIFLKGEYYLPARPSREHLIKTKEFQNDPARYVKPNGTLPYYAGIYIDYDTPTGRVSGDRARYKLLGDTVGKLSVPEASGYTFDGYAIVAENNYNVTPRPVSSSTVVNKNLEIKAQWISNSNPTPKPPAPDHSTGLPFTDVSEGKWYRDEVEYVYNHGYMNGTSKTEFSPNSKMTRGMLVTVLYRSAGSPSVTDAQREAFVDTQGDYYTDAVAWAKANNIIKGIDSTHFAPDNNITRQDTALIFARYCINYRGVGGYKEADLSIFADEHRVSDYAREGVEWAVAVELMEGSKESGRIYLEPRSQLTRAQAAALIMRCMEYVIK